MTTRWCALSQPPVARGGWCSARAAPCWCPLCTRVCWVPLWRLCGVCRSRVVSTGVSVRLCRAFPPCVQVHAGASLVCVCVPPWLRVRVCVPRRPPQRAAAMPATRRPPRSTARSGGSLSCQIAADLSSRRFCWIAWLSGLLWFLVSPFFLINAVFFLLPFPVKWFKMFLYSLGKVVPLPVCVCVFCLNSWIRAFSVV